MNINKFFQIDIVQFFDFFLDKNIYLDKNIVILLIFEGRQTKKS